MLLRSSSEAVEPEGIIEELERYFREPIIDRKSGNPHDWWKRNTNRFTRLSALERQYLSWPSSVVSRRVFSTVGDIYEAGRSSLKGENAEKLCFLYYNLPLLVWSYWELIHTTSYTVYTLYFAAVAIYQNSELKTFIFPVLFKAIFWPYHCRVQMTLKHTLPTTSLTCDLIWEQLMVFLITWFGLYWKHQLLKTMKNKFLAEKKKM